MRHLRLPRRHPTSASMDMADVLTVFSVDVVEVMDKNAPVYCVSCRRRQRYADCSRCQRPVCSLCSWSCSFLMMNGVRSSDERCRECVEK